MWGHDSTVWRSTMGNTQALDLGWDWSEGRHQGAANVRFVTTRFDSVAFQHRGSFALSVDHDPLAALRAVPISVRHLTEPSVRNGSETASDGSLSGAGRRRVRANRTRGVSVMTAGSLAPCFLGGLVHHQVVGVVLDAIR
jgi:hypothetical protein